MIIVDFSQLVIAAFTIKEEMSPTRARIQIIQRLAALEQRFRRYGEMVIATEGRQSWRHAIFPHYKCKRAQRKSDERWQDIYQFRTDFTEELRIYAPWRIVSQKYAEADDVIATLVMTYASKTTPVVIISGDQDFLQLHRFGAQQFDPRKKAMLSADEFSLVEKVIHGDSGDSIPNVLSDDDTFAVEGKRQTRITRHIRDRLSVVHDGVSFYRLEEDHYPKWIRNSRLIDLTMTPQYIRNKILVSYHRAPGPNKLLDYARDYRLRGISDIVGSIRGSKVEGQGQATAL